MKLIASILFLFISFTSFAQNKTHGSVGVTLSFPWVNNFSFYDYSTGKSTNKSGFAGLGGSIFYKQNRNKFSVSYSLIADAIAPIGPIDYSPQGIRTDISAQFIEATFHRNVYKKINTVLGLNFSNYQFDYISYVSGSPSYTKHDKTIGLTTGFEYSFSNHFFLAAFYRPAIHSFDTKPYKHTISLDARFDINIWKKK